MIKTRLILHSIALLLSSQFQFAQNQNADANLLTSYEDYTEMNRELVYAHLNKSIYIKGETIGLKAYVLDKYSQQLASQAANLYCSISDAAGKVVESKLLMVENGTAIGDFDIGDNYTSGNYTITLYTNWMRNFNEQNLFVETIRIIDPNVETQMITNTDFKNIDAQFLPEGGHLLVNVENTLGVVIKNNKGLGLPNLEGEIVDQDGVTVTNFKVNHLGIGKCLLTPKEGQNYNAIFAYEGSEYTVNIKGVKAKGMALNLVPLKDKVALTIKTNTNTLAHINQKLYKLAIHNGQDLKVIDFKFDQKTEVLKVIANADLYRGINIFTVFDAKNNPLLERLHFNYEGIDTVSSSIETVQKDSDTVTVTIPYDAKYAEVQNSFSVSVLPKDTNGLHHQNIISYTFLQPYVKGYLEQAQYYFTEVTPKKQFELDNVLITQGWSSYDWNTIFNNPPEYDFDYENGISYTINSSEKGDKQLMIYPSLNHSTKLISLTKENPSYTASGLFPVQDEAIRIRDIGSGLATKPKLYIQFDPIKIPKLNSHIDGIEASGFNLETSNIELSMPSILNKVETLDEVIINKKKGYTEIEKIKNRSLGKVEAIDETLVRRYRTLLRYLRDKGFTVVDTPTKFELYSNAVNSHRDRVVINQETNYLNIQVDPDGQAVHLRDNPEIDEHVEYVRDAATFPIVYLDGMVLHEDLSILREFTLDQIEWIEVNKSGVGGGMRSGGAGLIRIKTNPTSKVKLPSTEVYGTYDIPLKFSVAKKFYIPEYVSYDNAFFNTFGVIDWFPNLTLNDIGDLEFRISDKQLKEFKVVVEGVVNNTFVSEIKTITLN
ncbi:hypothetical protein [Psychroserpens sp. MEBiC05023]